MIGSVPAPHLPTTPLLAPQIELNPNFLLSPGAKTPLCPGAGMLGGGGTGLAVRRQRGFAGRVLPGCRRQSCRGDNAACLFATAKMAVLKGEKKKKEKCFCTSSHRIF